MARRVISSGKESGSGDQSRGRSIQGRSAQGRSPQGRSVSSDGSRCESGGFVDARKLRSEDLVAKTLDETSGTLGVITRPKVVDFSARLKERRKANTRMIVMRVAASAGVIAAIVALVWLLFFSSVFRLESSGISVDGANEWVSQEQVLSIARQQAGKSLLLVSGDDVEKKIKDIPGVTSAKAVKRLPNSLEVTIKAQKPAAMLKTSEGTMTAVDSQGRVLNSVSGASVEGIPVIEVADVDESLKNRSIKEALKVLSSLPDSMRNSITRVTAETQDSITTELNDGDKVIVWGDSSQLKLKKAVVDKIINDPNVIGDKHNVDVSAPLRPIIK
ncbi:cell division protein FtsQ/DivIB [Bifidobacterium moukalabense]|uniref:cell division protein FtsQ/DivIB n=1 Tax=Bifidobacterium moukalabense TaxID=1333651 RepID=UPI0010F7F1AB|nr:FtsQ-type POTRA domain-containing protein [Bifidobacterium moukalabense]